MRRIALVIAVVALAASFTSPAEARDENACQLAWSQAVRSYLTTNRTAAPDGTVPSDLDAQELAAQAWLKTFASACRMEAEGDKAGARVEAATLGVQVLAKLDVRGCARFLQYYMDASNGRDVCSVGKSADTAELRKQVAAAIPQR